ncbi:hypothetical protein J6590_101505, partial [Homalodisca vitripennis]
EKPSPNNLKIKLTKERSRNLLHDVGNPPDGESWASGIPVPAIFSSSSRKPPGISPLLTLIFKFILGANATVRIFEPKGHWTSNSKVSKDLQSRLSGSGLIAAVIPKRAESAASVVAMSTRPERTISRFEGRAGGETSWKWLPETIPDTSFSSELIAHLTTDRHTGTGRCAHRHTGTDLHGSVENIPPANPDSCYAPLPRRWNVRRLEKSSFEGFVNSKTLGHHGSTEDLVTATMTLISSACEQTCPGSFVDQGRNQSLDKRLKSLNSGADVLRQERWGTTELLADHRCGRVLGY